MRNINGMRECGDYRALEQLLGDVNEEKEMKSMGNEEERIGE